MLIRAFSYVNVFLTCDVTSVPSDWSQLRNTAVSWCLKHTRRKQVWKIS